MPDEKLFPPPTRRDKAWGILIAIKQGEPLTISEKISPQNKNEFIEYAKEFIRWNMSNEFQLEFNDDYTKIRKTNQY